MWGVVAAYVTMYIAQSQGGAIIAALHGKEVAANALSELTAESVQSDLSVRDLCAGYAAAHFDSTSNILHSAGMVATLWLFIYTTTLFFFGHGNPKFYLYLPPLYYLPAWVGHFVFQKDIPAVFTHGQSAQGLLNGEYCAFEDLFNGGIARDPAEVFYSSILLITMIGGLFQFGGIWPKPKPVDKGSKRVKES